MRKTFTEWRLIMIIHRIMCGEIKNNNFIVEKEGRCLIIDLTDFDRIDAFIEEKGFKVEGVLLTHSHWDHLLGVDEFVKKYRVPVYMGSRKPNYVDRKEFSYTVEKYGLETKFDVEVTFLDEGSYNIGGFAFDLIEVPGHTYCSVIYYFKEIQTMFTGDFLFRKAVGIVNSQYSNKELMAESIARIKTYPDETKIYPGHGPLTILGREKRENPYLIKGYRE